MVYCIHTTLTRKMVLNGFSVDFVQYIIQNSKMLQIYFFSRVKGATIQMRTNTFQKDDNDNH